MVDGKGICDKTCLVPSSEAAVCPGIHDIPALVLASQSEAADGTRVATAVSVTTTLAIVEIAFVSELVLTVVTGLLGAELEGVATVELVCKSGKPVCPAGGPVASPEDDLCIKVSAENNDLADVASLSRIEIDTNVVAGSVSDERDPACKRVLLSDPVWRDAVHELLQGLVGPCGRIRVDVSPEPPLVVDILEGEQAEAEEEAV